MCVCTMCVSFNQLWKDTYPSYRSDRAAQLTSRNGVADHDDEWAPLPGCKTRCSSHSFFFSIFEKKKFERATFRRFPLFLAS